MKKRSKAIKSGLPCFSCCCPYHEDKICISVEFSTYGIKRIQEFNERNSIHTEFLIPLTKAYHSFKPVKMGCIQNQKQGTKDKRKHLCKRCLSLLMKILNSDDVFKNWKTHTHKQKKLFHLPFASRCCSLLRLFVFLV